MAGSSGKRTHCNIWQNGTIYQTLYFRNGDIVLLHSFSHERFCRNDLFRDTTICRKAYKVMPVDIRKATDGSLFNWIMIRRSQNRIVRQVCMRWSCSLLDMIRQDLIFALNDGDHIPFDKSYSRKGVTWLRRGERSHKLHAEFPSRILVKKSVAL